MKKGIIAVGIICLMLSGCAKKNSVEEDFLNVQDTTAVQEAGSSTEEVQPGENNYKVDYTVSGEQPGAELVVNVVIDTRVPDRIATEKVKKVSVDDEYLKKLAAGIFDRGEYEVLYLPDYDMDEINASMVDIEQSLEEKAYEYGGPFVPSKYYGLLKGYQVSSSASHDVVDKPEAGRIIGKGQLESEGVTGYCESAYLRGRINGEVYILVYNKYDYDENTLGYEDTESIEIIPYDGQQYYISYMDFENGANAYGENKVSHGDAMALAEDCIYKLGFDTYALATEFHSICNYETAGVYNSYENMTTDGIVVMDASLMEYSGDLSKNGYRFVFTPSLDGLQLADCGESGCSKFSALSYHENGNMNGSWIQPYIMIDVDSTGIRQIVINQVYEMEETLTEASNIISFEQANEAAQAAFSAEGTEYYTVTDIRFEYIIIEYENESVMAPAWVYYVEGVSGQRALLAVNALDGSVIHMSYAWTSAYWIN